MKTIKEKTILSTEIKKSKFITFLIPVQNVWEVEKHLEDIKSDYKDATHYCYAYKIGPIQKYDDDKEPSGTAGVPIMDALNKSEIDFVLCVVVRYFGGIKLGASGLVRAYRNSVYDALANSKVIELEKGYLIEITVPYDSQKQVDYILKDYHVQKEFHEEVIYLVELEKEKIELLSSYSYQILEEKYIEKK